MNGIPMPNSSDKKDRAKLAKKLLSIQSKIDSVKKTGENNYAGYNYLTLSNVLEAIRKHLIEEGITVITSVVNTGVDKDITHLTVEYTFIDTDTGEELKVFGSGSAKDSQGFGVPKALTIAQKIMFEKMFLIPTHDDPESDHANPSYTKTKPTTNNKSTTFTKPKTSKTKVSQPKAVSKPSFGKKVTSTDTVEPSF